MYERQNLFAKIAKERIKDDDGEIGSARTKHSLTRIDKTTADSFLRTYFALILLARFIQFLFLDIYSGETLGNWKFVFCLVYTSNTFLKFVFATRKERLSKENRI